MTYGFSRDDMGKFLPGYLAAGRARGQPAVQVRRRGRGPAGRARHPPGRHANARLKVGICGEHGGDPTGVGFFHKVGLDYVSCSPFRVPVARLAAAHAVLGLL